MADEVQVEFSGRVTIITINRPQARNAINHAVSAAVAQALDDLDERDDLTVGIITGAGGTFSSGMDLKAFLAGENVTVPGRGLAGLTQRPAGEAAHRRRRGLGAGGRLRDRPRLRPDRRGGRRQVRHPGGQARPGGGRGRPGPAAAADTGRDRHGARADR